MTLDLDALEALEKKATQGPWTPKCFVGDNWQCVYPDEEHDTSIGSWENMALIAAARNALPELIRLARIGQRVEREVVQLGLCEIRNLTLKADTLYRFKKMHQCVSCQNYEDGK